MTIAHLMVTKGALQNVLDACSKAETTAGAVVDIALVREKVQQHLEEFSKKGFRTLGVACKDMGPATQVSKADEAGMTFVGFLVLFDPPKPNIVETIASLKSLGVSLKIITGDNRLVAASVSQQMGLSSTKILAGPELHQLSDGALLHQVVGVDVFAEIEPNQKERIILALKKAGNVVGYMGDGINDASALHAADVGISVDSAVDVAKEAADIVLLEKDLGVLVQGVREGRTTFANTLKYVFMATSANFGNMFSMAGASLFLPYLPLLPAQILLTNLMTDFPEMTIATDSVDKRNGRPSAALGHRGHSQVHDYLRPGEFGVRFSNVRHTSAHPACDPRPVPNWLVSGVGHFGLADRVGHSKPEAFLQEQAGKVSIDRDAGDGCRNGGSALHAAWSALRIQPCAAFVPSAHSNDRRALHYLGRDGEGGLLQKSEIVTTLHRATLYQ